MNANAHFIAHLDCGLQEIIHKHLELIHSKQRKQSQGRSIIIPGKVIKVFPKLCKLI